jgi:hypothetical protein
MRALLAVLLLAGPDAGTGSRYEDPQSVAVLSAGPGGLQVEVTIKPGFHLNDDYPINFKPDFAGPKVDKKQMAFTPCKGHPEHQCAVKIPIPYPAAKGMLGGTVAFAACDPDICLIKKVPLSVRVER